MSYHHVNKTSNGKMHSIEAFHSNNAHTISIGIEWPVPIMACKAVSMLLKCILIIISP